MTCSEGLGNINHGNIFFMSETLKSHRWIRTQFFSADRDGQCTWSAMLPVGPFDYRSPRIHADRMGSECGKIGAHIDWSMGLPEKAAPVTRAILRTAGLVPADSRR